MKITAIADLHGHEPRIAPCDLLLIGGDILMGGADAPDQRGILHEVTGPWLAEQLMTGVRHVVAVAGNHDFIFQQEPERVPPLPWTYLQDSGVELNGLKIWGSPWQLPFYDWAFNLEEQDLAEKWALIPDDTDILLTHSPPYGFGDRTREGHVGSRTLRERVEQIKPRLHVFGHIHVARGVWRNSHTTFVNAALVDARYRLRHNPFEFQWNDGGLRQLAGLH
ncbi:MAG: metallophosphoesterase [Planctomycetales bacterium]|nr:metallophosphoesterase [Planctomycetales bacterium]